MILDYLSSIVSGWGDTGHAEMFTTIVPSGSQAVRRGKVMGIDWIIGNATNVITMTATIYDPAGNVLISKSGLAKNATTPQNMGGASDIPIIYSGCRIGFDPSGDSGAVHITGQAKIAYDDLTVVESSILFIPVLSFAVDTLLTVLQIRGQLVLVTAAATITLPPVVAGSIVTVYSTTAAAVMVDPDSNDRIVLDGVAGGDGKKITSASGAGDLVTLIGDSAAGWITVGRSGTWTLES